MKPETLTDHALTVNGEAFEIPPGTTVTDLLRRLGRDPEQPGVAVAVNGAVVRRTTWSETELHPGDDVEVITARQGG